MNLTTIYVADLQEKWAEICKRNGQFRFSAGKGNFGLIGVDGLCNQTGIFKVHYTK